MASAVGGRPNQIDVMQVRKHDRTMKFVRKSESPVGERVTAVQRWGAFTDGANGDNPAGVVLDANDMTGAEQQSLAREVGYSETAFVIARNDEAALRAYDIHYFSPQAKVPFCGHATIAEARRPDAPWPVDGSIEQSHA